MLFEAAHEGFHRRPILGGQTEGMRAGDDFLGATRSQPVERLVQVHDQAMQAVLAGIRDADQLADLGRGDFIGRLGGRLRLDGGEPVGRRLGLGRRAGLDRVNHARHVGENRLAQRRQLGRGDPSGRDHPRVAHQGIDRHRIEAGGPAFGVQAGRRVARLVHMFGGGLQGAHAHLDAVVRRQALGDEGRQQDIALPELLDNARFHMKRMA